MPISLPNLDDRTYGDLLEEARSLIPTYEPEWTNHNPSDPGITLVELFAYLSEMMLYRLNRVTDANMHAFLRLLNGPGREPPPGETLNETVRKTVLRLRRPYRAVTCQDFEYLSFEASGRLRAYIDAQKNGSRDAADPRDSILDDIPDLNPSTAATWGAVGRALCVPNLNLENLDPVRRYNEQPGHVSVIIVPAGREAYPRPQPTAGLLWLVKTYLEKRRLVATRVHVVAPRYLRVTVRLTLVVKPDALTLEEDDVRRQAEQAVRRFLHPLTGGPEGAGWPFGRNVYVSELYDLLDRLPVVDYVTNIDPETDGPYPELSVTGGETGRLIHDAQGGLVGVEIKPDELVEPTVSLKIDFGGKK
jgi:hypothetical protein